MTIALSTTLLTTLILLTSSLLPITFIAADEGDVQITGELRKWHKITLTFEGATTFKETGKPNPFADYRLNVIFTNDVYSYYVPGYFACDGNAGETSAPSGNKWRVHFAPDRTGTWSYAVSFRYGENVAMEDAWTAGRPISFDGISGSFDVRETDKNGRDLRGKGRLEYVGGHHLRFKETGEYFMKQGADSPENFLAYDDFDGTPSNPATGAPYGYRKSWTAHERDWRRGDPTWKNGRGKGIIGAINYLSSKGMNAISFLTMNILGDDKNVFPYVPTTNYRRKNSRFQFDCSKLDQWEIVLEHFDERGIYMHVKMQETENDQLLDGGTLGRERILYYRELVARFSHHLALNWNIGEENSNTDWQRRRFASYVRSVDPYRHHIVVHNGNSLNDNQANTFAPLLGWGSDYTGLSVQTRRVDFEDVYETVALWVRASADSGKKWVVAVDESGGPAGGIRPDDDPGMSHEYGRRNGLWGTIMAGGAGCEYFFGMLYHDSDLTCQDYRSRDRWWNYCRYALDFFYQNGVPFWRMSSDEFGRLTTNRDSWCLVDDVDGFHYVIYLKNGGKTSLDVSRHPEGTIFHVYWYDPREGGGLIEGLFDTIVEKRGDDDLVFLGRPPYRDDEDWVIYVRHSSVVPLMQPSEAPTVVTESPSENPSESPSYHYIATEYPTEDGSYSSPPAQSCIRTPTNTPIFSNCFLDQTTGGCDDEECEKRVCCCDSFCCDHRWDTFCVENEICGSLTLCRDN